MSEQNEDVILGMDWMGKEDVMLHPKMKAITKHTATMEQVNSADLTIEEMLAKHPSLTDENDQQNITTAPYEHVIDTGEANPTVTRDYRRSPAENEAIKKEVELCWLRR